MDLFWLLGYGNGLYREENMSGVRLGTVWFLRVDEWRGWGCRGGSGVVAQCRQKESFYSGGSLGSCIIIYYSWYQRYQGRYCVMTWKGR